MTGVVVRVAGRDGTDGTVVIVDGGVTVVDVMAGTVVVVDVGRVVADEGLRSQGFGGDACMGKDRGRRKGRQAPREPLSGGQ